MIVMRGGLFYNSRTRAHSRRQYIGK